MKKLSIILIIIAVLLSDVMCAVVAYNYCKMIHGIKDLGYSAPVGTVFLLSIPFLIGIAICILGAVIVQKK